MEHDKQTILTEKVERRYMVQQKAYIPHPLDEMVYSRKKKVRVENEDGTFSVSIRDVPYKVPRYERRKPFVNLGNKYPSHGKKRSGTAD